MAEEGAEMGQLSKYWKGNLEDLGDRKFLFQNSSGSCPSFPRLPKALKIHTMPLEGVEYYT